MITKHCICGSTKIWRAKTREHGPLCLSCYNKRKSLISPVMKHEPRKPINKVSDKQDKLNKAYLVLRKQFLKDHPVCQYCNSTSVKPDYCCKIATDIHHMGGRGKYFLDTSTWMSTCREHHTWIHDHDKEARELGYLKSRLDK